MKTVIFFLCCFFILSLYSCKENSEKKLFSAAFITDIHLQPEKNAIKGFRKVIDTLNTLNVDFTITGGDLIMDALGQTYERSDSLYNLYIEESKSIKSKIYNTPGNHELYGVYINDSAISNHPEYGINMYKKKLGKDYYTFSHKGWQFVILNSIKETKDKKYIGFIDSNQIKWLNKISDTIPKNKPIAITSHIPFMTLFKQKYYGSTLPNDSSLVVSNSKQVLDIFINHNLKLVLQGHLHIVEELNIDGIKFITGGAVSGHWWKGKNFFTEEGFLKLNFYGNSVNCKYIDYNWNVSN